MTFCIIGRCIIIYSIFFIFKIIKFLSHSFHGNNSLNIDLRKKYYELMNLIELKNTEDHLTQDN